MRTVTLGRPLTGREVPWLVEAVREIERASHENVDEVADAFTLSNVTPNHTLDPTTVTLPQLAQVVATMLQDMQKRGTKRTND